MTRSPPSTLLRTSLTLLRSSLTETEELMVESVAHVATSAYTTHALHVLGLSFGSGDLLRISIAVGVRLPLITRAVIKDSDAVVSAELSG